MVEFLFNVNEWTVSIIVRVMRQKETLSIRV